MPLMAVLLTVWRRGRGLMEQQRIHGEVKKVEIDSRSSKRDPRAAGAELPLRALRTTARSTRNQIFAIGKQRTLTERFWNI
jgi:hypothetical protein